MTEVETVALWSGLISGIVSIVLSIVAIVFAILVDRRSREVSNQTIQSLQKIESSVERLSADTGGLIKAAWDKMLGDIGHDVQAPETQDSIKSIASGLAAELRSELVPAQVEGGDEAQQTSNQPNVDAVVQRLERNLERQLSSIRRDRTPTELLEALLKIIPQLSQRATELVRLLLEGGHLTRAQYTAILGDDEIAPALRELRNDGLIIPMRGGTESGGNEPVYWFVPGLSDLVRIALVASGQHDSQEEQGLRTRLKAVGYPQQWLERRREQG